jgi:hypothetical protein
VASDREATADAGWVTTQVAARSLDISPRTVRWHIEQGHIEAKPEGEGVRRSWLVSIDSLQAFRDARQRQRQSPGGYREEQQSADIAAQPPGNPIRELADRLVEEAARASEFRVRLELSERAQSTLEEQLAEERARREMAESTLREGMAEEQRRREQAERERDDLRRELYALREPRESPEEGEEQQGRGQPHSEAPDAQESVQRPWWRRVLGR